MRIVHLDSDDLDNPLRGGQPIRTYEVNTRLSQVHDITVLTATYPGSARRLQRGRLCYRRLGVTLPGLGLSPHLSFMATMGLATRSIPHDLVVEEFAPPIGFGLAPWFTKQPVVSIVQWFYFADWQRRYKLPFERIMRTTSHTQRYKNFIVQSDHLKKYFAALLPEARIWTLGCGVDEALFEPPGRDGRYALFLGRLDVDHKGLDLLLSAWSRNTAAGSHIPLKIAGEGPGRLYLEKEIVVRGLDGQITLLGRLEGNAKRDVLRDCAFLVMPSRQETFGMTALEAMAASKPVVAFDIDNLNEVLRDDWALLSDAFDVGAFAQAVLTLWNDADKRLSLGERGFRAAQPRRWDAIAVEQSKIYNEIVESKNDI